MSKRNVSQILALTLSVLCLAACGRTVVRPETGMRNFRLPKPHQIIVTDFAVEEGLKIILSGGTAFPREIRIQNRKFVP